MSESNRSAFPLYSPANGPEWGLTKRELIAAMAMQGLLSNPNCIGTGWHKVHCEAVQKADELLAELAKP